MRGAGTSPAAPPSADRATLSADGRYAIFGQIAAGGMATLHVGRLIGAAGFARTVAIKRLRRKLTSNAQFVAMFIDEARIAARIRHPNVAATIDVFRQDQELCLVLEYVHGASLRNLLSTSSARGDNVDPRIVCGVLCGALHGLHAAHEAKNERGEPLGIVHRDVSPQNVLVGADGIPRVVDFGIAKAAGRLHTTAAGQMKGKWFYMAPEQLNFYVDPSSVEREPDRRTDVFAAGIVAWEALTGERLFHGHDEIAVMKAVLERPIPKLRRLAPEVPEALEIAVLRALEREPSKRFATAREFALALEDALPRGIASPRAIGEWVESLVGVELTTRDRYLRQIEEALPGDVRDARASLASSAPPRRKPEPFPDDAATRETSAPLSTSQVTIADPRTPSAPDDDGQTRRIDVGRGVAESTDAVTLTMKKPSQAALGAPPPAPADERVSDGLTVKMAPAVVQQLHAVAARAAATRASNETDRAASSGVPSTPRVAPNRTWVYVALVLVALALAAIAAMLVAPSTSKSDGPPTSSAR